MNRVGSGDSSRSSVPKIMASYPVLFTLLYVTDTNVAVWPCVCNFHYQGCKALINITCIVLSRSPGIVQAPVFFFAYLLHISFVMPHLGAIILS